jgi:hypothetical protein
MFFSLRNRVSCPLSGIWSQPSVTIQHESLPGGNPVRCGRDTLVREIVVHPRSHIPFTDHCKWNYTSRFDGSTNMGPARSGRYPGSSRCIGGRCGRLWPARFRRSRAAEAGCCDPNSSTLSWRPTARFRGSSGTRRIGSGCDCARCLKSKSRSHRFGGTCAHARWPWALLGHEISVLQSCEFGGEAQVDWYEGWVQFDGVSARRTYSACAAWPAAGPFIGLIHTHTQQAFLE